jgi:hypothetical protein
MKAGVIRWGCGQTEQDRWIGVRHEEGAALAASGGGEIYWATCGLRRDRWPRTLLASSAMLGDTGRELDRYSQTNRRLLLISR